jgi:hypothetical protein
MRQSSIPVFPENRTRVPAAKNSSSGRQSLEEQIHIPWKIHQAREMGREEEA